MSRDKLRPLMKAVADLPLDDTGIVLDIVTELRNNQHGMLREGLRTHVARYRGARHALHVSHPLLYKIRPSEETRTFDFGIGMYPETATASEDVFFKHDVCLDTLRPEHNWYGRTVALQIASVGRGICGKKELEDTITENQCFSPSKARALFASLMKAQLDGSQEVLLDCDTLNYFLLDIDPTSPFRIVWLDGKWDFREVGDLIPKIEKGSKLFLAV